MCLRVRKVPGMAPALRWSCGDPRTLRGRLLQALTHVNPRVCVATAAAAGSGGRGSSSLCPEGETLTSGTEGLQPDGRETPGIVGNAQPGQGPCSVMSPRTFPSRFLHGS